MISSSSQAFFSSDLDRAVETAQIIDSVLAIKPQGVKTLRDLSWGKAFDMPLEEAHTLELEKTKPLFD